jgi:hypothetical protein
MQEGLQTVDPGSPILTEDFIIYGEQPISPTAKQGME